MSSVCKTQPNSEQLKYVALGSVEVSAANPCGPLIITPGDASLRLFGEPEVVIPTDETPKRGVEVVLPPSNTEIIPISQEFRDLFQSPDPAPVEKPLIQVLFKMADDDHDSFCHKAIIDRETQVISLIFPINLKVRDIKVYCPKRQGIEFELEINRESFSCWNPGIRVDLVDYGITIVHFLYKTEDQDDNSLK